MASATTQNFDPGERESYDDVSAQDIAKNRRDGRRWLEGVLGETMSRGNSIELLEDARIFDGILHAIHEAQDSIEMVVYVWWKGRVGERLADALIDAAGRGVHVRLLVDAVGALPMPFKVRRRLRTSKVHFMHFRVPWITKVGALRRTHRKIVVCDGELAFTGGFGIDWRWSREAKAPWRDLHYSVRGPAVRGLRSSFFQEWLEAGGDLATDLGQDHDEVGDECALVVSSVSSPGHSRIATAFRACLMTAFDSVRIQTPYFVVDKEFTRLLVETAGRGVKIEVIVPGDRIDHWVSRYAGERRYESLLEAGVSIKRYEPNMIHSKLMLVDDYLSVIGSANFNQRSLRHDDEIIMIVDSEKLNSRLQEVFEEDLKSCSPVGLDEWRDRGARQRGMERLASFVRHHV